MNGVMSTTTVIWYDNAIYEDPTRSLDTFSVSDIEYADAVDPVGISTWSNAVDGLGEFRDKGGKVLTFHGTRDPVIPSGQSKRFHDLLSSTIPPSRNSTHQHADGGSCGLDDFYRLFMIPGMGHCMGGPGAWGIGQGATAGTPTDKLNRTHHDVLLSLVKWVEGGEAPGVIVGTGDTGEERKHCLWPGSKSVWDGTAWDCVPA